MKTLMAQIRPRSGFGGVIRGDTLFGQLCWAILHRRGEARLDELLEGYTRNRPFLVVSDAFPSGFLPRPALPLHRYAEVSGADRKQVKKRNWIPVAHFAEPVDTWLHHAKPERKIFDADLAEAAVQPHNTINRMTGTTGTGEFAPYVMPQLRFADGLSFDLYLAHDERIEIEEIRQLLADVGLSGYGRDASIGLGKFELENIQETQWPAQSNANAWYTLAPCAPQGMKLRPDNSWYQTFTRFGRHGDIAVHSGQPFKTPVLMADTAAILTPVEYNEPVFIGRGLGGDGSLSKAIPQTVHQGYAPVLPVSLEERA